MLLCCLKRLGSVGVLAAMLACFGGARSASAQFTCANPIPITVGVTFTGDNTPSPGDGVFNLCAPSQKAVWHSFTAPQSGLYTISTCGSSIDTVLALYSDCGNPVLACDDNTCASGSIIVASLATATTYRIRVAGTVGGAAGSYVLLVTPPGTTSPTNDTCAASIALQPNVQQRFSNAASSGFDQTATCGILDTSDVWFSFTAPITGTYRAQVCADGFSPALSIHSTCIGGQALQCAVDSAVPGCGRASARLSFSASAGQLALLRVAGQRSSFGPFDIVVHAPQFNDLCASAVALIVQTPYNGETSPIVATDTSVPCAVSGADVWHTFIAPATGVFTFDACASAFDTVLSLHSACPGTPGSSIIACNDDACSTRSIVNAPLIAGTQYFLRVAGKGSPPAWGRYTIRTFQQQPANDLCANAITVTEGVPIQGSTLGASGTDITPNCGLADNKDVFFAFIPTVSATYEIHNCLSVKDSTIAVFTSCVAAVPIACNDNDAGFCGPGTSNSRVVVPLSAGQRYIIRVAAVVNTEGDFTLNIARTPPAGETCASGISLGVDSTVVGTLTGAASTGIASCAPADAPDAWYAIVPPASRFYRFETCGSVLDGYLALYDGCPQAGGGGGPLLACASNNPDLCKIGFGATLTAFLEAGRTYRLRVAGRIGSPVGGAYRLSVSPVAPPNDECAGALSLALNTTITGATIGAQASSPLAPCATGDTRDVWFSFTPAMGGTYQFDTCAAPAAGTPLNTVMTLHEACAPLSVQCNDNASGPCAAVGGSRIIAQLVGGRTSFIRVSASGDAVGSFRITASVAAPLNDTCASATAINEGVFPFDTLAATNDPQFIQGCSVGFNLLTNDVWFRYTARASGVVTASTCGSNYDTAIAVSSATGGCPSGAYPVLACNDDAPCFPGSPVLTVQSQVSWNVTAGSAYFIRIGSRLGNVGSGALRVTNLTSCRCDWNANGMVSNQDLFAFLGDWFAGAGDFNRDGATTIQDVFDFLTCIFAPPAGC